MTEQAQFRKLERGELATYLGPDVEVIEYDDREQWLHPRGKSVGASEIAASCGLDEYKSRFKLWALKTGRIPPEPTKPIMQRGHDLEELIGRRFAEECLPAGGEILAPWPHHTARRKESRWVTCTLDFIARESSTSPWFVVDGKTVGHYSEGRWEPEKEPPFANQLQLQAQMHVTGLEKGSLAGLMMNSWLLIERNYTRSERLIELLLKGSAKFHNQVMAKTPPPASWADLPLIREALQPTGEPVQLSAKADEMISELDEIKADQKDLSASMRELKKRADQIEADLRIAMNDAPSATTPNGVSLTVESYKRKGYTVASKNATRLTMKGSE